MNKYEKYLDEQNAKIAGSELIFKVMYPEDKRDNLAGLESMLVWQIINLIEKEGYEVVSASGSPLLLGELKKEKGERK